MRPTGRIYNKILANVVRSLKVNEDARQQELAIKILEACPELVTGFASYIVPYFFLIYEQILVSGGTDT